MKITIEGDGQQIQSACKELAKKLPRYPRGRRPSAETTARNERLIAQRKTLRAAFDLIRHDQDQRPLVDMFASALGGRREVTGELLESAEQIIRSPR